MPPPSPNCDRFSQYCEVKLNKATKNYAVFRRHNRLEML